MTKKFIAKAATLKPAVIKRPTYLIVAPLLKIVVKEKKVRATKAPILLINQIANDESTVKANTIQ